MDRDALIAAMKASAARAAVPQPVDVPGWPRVFIRVLTVAEVDANRQADKASTDKREIARGAARVMCDETGARIFDPENDEHVTLIASLPWPTLQKVVSAADDRNGNSEAAAVEAGNG